MKKIKIAMICLFICIAAAVPVSAGILSTIRGTAQIQPMNDGSGKYMLRSTGFYCLNEDGTLSEKEEIHYIEQLEMDGKTFHGFYYHDKDGCFRAYVSHLVPVKNISVMMDLPVVSEEDGEQVMTQEPLIFDGLYRIGALGKLDDEPKVRYIDETIDGKTLQGYYYFDESGRLITETGIYALKMNCRNREFDGYYYFGGPDGALVSETGYTPDGYPFHEDGKILQQEDLGIGGLKKDLWKTVKAYVGNWSVYVKDLESGESHLYMDKQMASASTIKLFVMAGTYQNMERILENQADLMNLDVSDESVRQSVDTLLWNMITISDNESFNELVRLQSKNHGFIQGARVLNVYLRNENYTDTKVLHTLKPSASEDEGIGATNLTSAKDCGILLEKIYNGECVNQEASEEMMGLLLEQKQNHKIPTGLPQDIACAHKTGENTDNQHDVGIIFGEQRDYILCILSENYGVENDAFDHMKEIAQMTYTYTNKTLDPEDEPDFVEMS